MLLARIERTYRWLVEQGDAVFADAKAERWERAADSAEDRLAIAPLTRAKLGLDRMRGAALADHLAEHYGGER